MTKHTLFPLLFLFVFLAACISPQPSPTPALQEGQVYMEQAGVLVLESYPVQIQVHIAGNLPTPCHTLQYEIAEPDADSKIAVTVWSEVDPELICTQVLQPFEESIPIPTEDLPDGSYAVWLNGEQVGEFNYPG